MDWRIEVSDDITARVLSFIPDLEEYVSDLKVKMTDRDLVWTSSRGTIYCGHHNLWPDMLSMTRTQVIYNLGDTQKAREWIYRFERIK